jgi:Tol biopolymer transport system component
MALIAGGIAAAVLVGALALTSARLRPGGVLGDKQYPPETAPSIRLKPASLTVGLGPSKGPEEARVNMGFTASWSADSKILAVTGGRTGDEGRALWVADGSGDGSPTAVFDNAVDAVASPDGKWVALTGFGERSPMPYVQAFELSGAVASATGKGGKYVQVLATAADAVLPSFSPDSAKLAFLRTDDQGDLTLVIARPPGPGGVPDTTLTVGVAFARPLWSGDAKTVYYVDARAHQVFSVAADGTGKPAQVTRARGGVDSISITRDGAKLAYLDITKPGTQTAEGFFEPPVGVARVLELSGGQVSNPLGDQPITHPSISADGRRLWAGTEGGVVVADTDGSSRGFLPIARRRAYLPTPSPDGKRVAVISPSSEFSAVLIRIDLGTFARDVTYVVGSAELTPTADADPPLEALMALEPTSDEDTANAFAPGWPAAFPSAALPGLPVAATIVGAGRFDARADADRMASRLTSAGLTPRIAEVK